jgi:hypothetical protein
VTDDGVAKDGVAVSTAESGSVFVSSARMEIPWLLGWSVVGLMRSTSNRRAARCDVTPLVLDLDF